MRAELWTLSGREGASDLVIGARDAPDAGEAGRGPRPAPELASVAASCYPAPAFTSHSQHSL
jgi:hypothetical protein